MIGQSAFLVDSWARFIGIIVFNRDSYSALHAAKTAWGEAATYNELTAEELAQLTKQGGLSVFCCTIE